MLISEKNLENYHQASQVTCDRSTCIELSASAIREAYFVIITETALHVSMKMLTGLSNEVFSVE